MDDNNAKAMGCLVFIIFAAAALCASVAVGFLFGAGYGFLAASGLCIVAILLLVASARRLLGHGDKQ